LFDRVTPCTFISYDVSRSEQRPYHVRHRISDVGRQTSALVTITRPQSDPVGRWE